VVNIMKNVLQRKISLKIVLALLTTAIIVSSSVIYVFAQNPTETFWLSAGLYPGSPSYTVWRDGSTYYAKYSDGSIDYYSTNASQVIQNVFDAIDSTGGDILFKTGTYELDVAEDHLSSVFLDLRGGEGNIGIYGEKGAVWSLNCFTWMNRCIALFIGGGSNVRISGLTFDCLDSYVVQVIYSGAYEPTHQLTVDNCRFINGATQNSTISYLPYGICSHGGRNHVYTENYFENWALPINVEGGNDDEIGHVISNNVIQNTTDVGIILENSAANASDTIQDITIIGNTITVGSEWAYPTSVGNGGINLNLDTSDNDGNIAIIGNTITGTETTPHLASFGVSVQGGSEITISGNVIRECYNNYTSYAGIRVGTGAATGTENVTVTGNTIQGCTRGIMANETGVDFVLVSNNVILGVTTHDLNLTGTNSIAKDNVFDGNQNWGTATLPNGVDNVDVTVSYITANSLVILTILDDSTLAAGESLKVESITGRSSFKVKCIDEGAASAAIEFSYYVINRG